MPIQLTRDRAPRPFPASCAAQATPRAATARVFEEPVPERLKGLVIRDGQLPTLEWTLADPRGAPIDVTGCAPDAVAVLRVLEASALACGPASFAGTVVDASRGRVDVALDPKLLGGPGIYRAELGVFAPDGTGPPLASEPFFLLVERGLFGESGGTRGPLTPAEIRLHLRDSGAAENRLLDARMFDDAELAACIARPVDYWNEAPPLLDFARHSTQDFPHRFHWLDATVALLYRLAAHWYRKNRLRYQAAGLAVDDLDKAQEFEAQADKLWQGYVSFVRAAKAQANLEACWGVAGSPYGRLRRYGPNLYW